MLAEAVAAVIRTAAGVNAYSLDPDVSRGACVFFANHSSHLDFLVIWAALPSEQRQRCVPVAAKDYWEKTRLRRYLACRVFHALLVDRKHVAAHNSPLTAMGDVLARGRSLIIFPEGTRSVDGQMGKFKSGLFHLARANPEARVVPVCLENLNRVLPKGELLPVPLLSSVTFGRPLALGKGETRDAFLSRAFAAVQELRRHEN